jgi:cadmium resistance protein CadD (predicted permease)
VNTLALLSVSLTVFASTNLDDLVLLAAWFADPTLRARTIVLGQLLGIGALVAASAAAALLALAVPDGWPALLGVVPFGIGVSKAWALRRPAVNDDEDDARPAPASARWQAFAVAAVTIANGGDNLAVYIPLFAQQPAHIPLHAAAFALMTLLWCALSRALVTHRAIGERLRRHGHVVVPVVLMALGLWILADARVLLR